MSIGRLIVTISAAGILAGCAFMGTYRAPTTPLPSDAYQRTYAASLDEVWAALIDHTSSTFFGIDNFEKSSGLMTLSFGAQQPERFVDCGWLEYGNVWDGPYAQYVSERIGATLDGKMNLRVRAISPDATSVRVTARYVFIIPGSSAAQRDIFTFDTTSTGKIAVRAAVLGTDPTRECRATQLAERGILDGIDAALKRR